MAATVSTMVPLGTEATRFLLSDPVRGAMVSLEQVQGARGLLVMFICNHCPYVKHVAGELARIGHDYLQKGIGIVAINPNNADLYPEDSPAKMVEEVERRGYPFPYLFDESQDTARHYGAVCTPDFFLFENSDSGQHLVYRGQLDDSRPNNGIEVSGNDLRGAIEAMLGGQGVTVDQRPSIGCNIKWK